MSQQIPDTISIQKTLTRSVSPESSALTVVIRGESFFTGNEAFKKAKELRAFIGELSPLGISEDQLSLKTVSMASKSGKFLSMSEAVYTVVVAGIKIEAISSVLSVVARQKNLTLDCIEWSYPHLETQKSELYKEAASSAKREAFAVADALGIPIDGIYEMIPSWTDPERITGLDGSRSSVLLKARGPASTSDDLKLNLGHNDVLALTLKCRFRVGAFVSGRS